MSLFNCISSRKNAREIHKIKSKCTNFRKLCVKTSEDLEAKNELFWSNVVGSISWVVPSDEDNVKEWRNMKLIFEVPNQNGRKSRFKVSPIDFVICFINIVEGVAGTMNVPDEVTRLIEEVPY